MSANLKFERAILAHNTSITIYIPAIQSKYTSNVHGFPDYFLTASV